MSRHRMPKLRFSIERLDDERWMVVDWCYGLVKVAGKGARSEQEQMLVLLKAYFALHGDANILALPKRLSTSPRWPGNAAPEPRSSWKAEQQQIAQAYARLGLLARGRDPKDVARSADFKQALHGAACLHQEALERLRRRVGLKKGA